MLTAENNTTAEIISVPTTAESVDNLLQKEWLLTNGRGGYAASTVLSCNTRRYHGLLVGTLRPPAHRIMALSACLDMVVCSEGIFNLSAFEFADRFAPDNFPCIKKFRRNCGVHFDYQFEHVQLTKSVYLLHAADTVAVVYEFTSLKEPVNLILRPFIGLRDFHYLQKSSADLSACRLEDKGTLLVRHNAPVGCELRLNCPRADFENDPQWWFDFVYRKDRERGQDFTEDLWAPGFFRCRIDSPAQVVLWATLRPGQNNQQIPRNFDIRRSIAQLHSRKKSIIDESLSIKKKQSSIRAMPTGIETTLALAADAFIATRESSHERRATSDGPPATSHESRATILAGFPWFFDWGRDTFVALPGLLLETGRFHLAKAVLLRFANAAEQGMIPNRFDDRTGTAHFNSIDASLWFINTAFQYLRTSGDTDGFTGELLPTITSIMDSYRHGTHFGIHADTDGLITGGNEQTQLTWMDARFEDRSFTPRHGKAVEVNALWYNALCLTAEFLTQRAPAAAAGSQLLADKVKDSFRRLFWNAERGYLNDCILPDGSVDSTIRPNQIFAVSLPFSPLTPTQQKAVVDNVQEHLLTPYGLRTLSPADSRYQGRCTGPQAQRDRAYHQGTVWPYLIGPFVQAYLKINNFSPESRKQACQFIEPLTRHLFEDGCLGQVSEIFDGDPPHTPRGCIAQAWSVAELLRAYKLIYG
ncbi:MAG TPA: amylo-alpha-1,6-glucosidase [Sedimentisphaerales bacterium]|nr:amylo-alpha-1,6-glucosidase [Sedimentisphaerales bacterium]